jgi:hypothetical protein
LPEEWLCVGRVGGFAGITGVTGVTGIAGGRRFPLARIRRRPVGG